MNIMNQPHPARNSAVWLEAVIQNLCHSAENNLQNAVGEKAWDEPLVAFSRGDDPLYEQYNRVHGTFPLNPVGNI